LPLLYVADCKYQSSVKCCLNLLKPDSCDAKFILRLVLGQACTSRGKKKESISKGSARQLNSVGLVNCSTQAESKGMPLTMFLLFFFIFFSEMVKGACA